MSGEKFTLFWQGPFSQWYPSQLIVNGLEFTCAEQFMMYSKAVLFNDNQTAKKILAATTPKEQKSLGRNIRNFDEKTWALFREDIVYTGNYAKFTQNFELQELLLATRGTTLAEASPYDKIWGIGLSEDDPKAQVRAKWKGLNLLGEILTRVREAIHWDRTRYQQQTLRIWQEVLRALKDDTNSWVLFEHGTLIMLTEPEDDLESQATKIMKEWGPGVGGTPSGDFGVIDFPDVPGWIVTGHYPNMLNYVSPEEVGQAGDEKHLHVIVGILGRDKRNMDANTLRIVHIEDKKVAHDSKNGLSSIQ